MKSSRQLLVASLMLALLPPPLLAAAEFDDLGPEIEFSPEFDRTDRDGLRRDTREVEASVGLDDALGAARGRP